MIFSARQGHSKEIAMKARFAVVLLVSIFSALNVARAQDRVQLFGGYSYFGFYYYPANSGPWTLASFQGWDGSGSVKVIRHIEIEGDFGGSYRPPYGLPAYSNSDAIRTYMGGPRVSTTFRRASLYGHVLFGGLTYKRKAGQGPGLPPFTSSDTTFAMAIGGGTDLRLTRHFGVRLVQIDYVRNNNSVSGSFASPGQHVNFRILTGAIFRFGR